MSDVTVYAIGLVSTSACVPVGLAKDEIERRVNAASPTGITCPWQLSDDTHFRTGEKIPQPCEQSPGREHWLLEC